MRKTTALVITTALTLGLAVGLLFGRPALAKISGGQVDGPWRCERFGALNERDAAAWLSQYAPGGPTQALVAAGGEGGGSWMICAHGPQVAGDE